MKYPPKWSDIYPHGTKEGDEECRFFIALARKQKYQWRSTQALSKEGNLTPERVEEIIKKYLKKGIIFQNPKNEDQWGYWERVPEMLPKDDGSVGKKDQKGRIDKFLSGSIIENPSGTLGEMPKTCLLNDYDLLMQTNHLILYSKE